MTSVVNANGISNGISANASVPKKVLLAKDLRFILEEDDDDDDDVKQKDDVEEAFSGLNACDLNDNQNENVVSNGNSEQNCTEHSSEVPVGAGISASNQPNLAFSDVPSEDNKLKDSENQILNNEMSLTIDITAVASSCAADERHSPSVNQEELDLLAKLEEANRLLETDKKSLRSRSPLRKVPPGDVFDSSASHTRHSSLSSQLSSVSSSSSTNSSTMEHVDDGVVSDYLWGAWRSVVDEWDSKYKKKTSHVKELVHKGIPLHFRGFVWPLLCGANDSCVKEKYLEYLRMSSPYEKLIRRDVCRTYPEHEQFKVLNGPGQESLFNIIKAYSLHDLEVGYCQGSGFIVGLLLMQMPEEEAFAVFVKIMQDYELRELYKPSMAEIGLCIYQLECMIQDLDPDLYSHFQMHGVFATMFASPWFLTLFTTSLPLPLACHVFDLFLSEGMETIFRVSFAILHMFSSELQRLDMEGIVKLLTKELPSRLDNETDRLFTTAFQVKYNARKMKKKLKGIIDMKKNKLEKDYNSMKTQENEDQLELRRLRTENRLLRQRIENLESETATLADRLVQDQVKYANQSEEVYALRRKMSITRRMSQVDVLISNSEVAQNTSVNNAEGRLECDSVASSDKLYDVELKQLRDRVADMLSKEINSMATIQDLRSRIKELELTNQVLYHEPSSDVQDLQEQLVVCKLREAEANMSTKELEQKVNELNRCWQKHQEFSNSPDSRGKASRSRLQELTDDLYASKLREANTMTELTEMKQKVVDLETKTHICERQIKRLEAENESLQEKVSEFELKEQSMETQIRGLSRQLSKSESTKQDEEMMSKIRDAEHSQVVAELHQRIAQLEIQNQELLTAEQLSHPVNQNDGQDIDRRIEELHEEIHQLKRLKGSSSGSNPTFGHSFSIESDSDFDDLESNRLHFTDSQVLALDNSLFGPGFDEVGGSARIDVNLMNFSDPVPNLLISESSGSILAENYPHSCSSDLDKTPTNNSYSSTSFNFNGSIFDRQTDQDDSGIPAGRLSPESSSTSLSLPGDLDDFEGYLQASSPVADKQDVLGDIPDDH